MSSSDRSQLQEQPPFEDLDPRRAPPRDLRDVFKIYSRAIVSSEDLEKISDSSCLREPEWILRKGIKEDLMQDLFQKFQEGNLEEGISQADEARNRMHSASIYESTVIPGRDLPLCTSLGFCYIFALLYFIQLSFTLVL